ncbi:MAG: glycosyltransferase [Butyrivibrio sp.]|nr:glycosyltransferase [Butyrivibrio sp.]
MRISVAMATYNGETTIVEQLMSIFKQSLPVDEVIICDDCSKDNTAAVVEKYISDNKLSDKIKIIVNEHNLGYASNFVKAMYECHGDYIFFCDQDDIWYPDRVKKMMDVMEANSKIQVLGSEFEPFIDSDNALSVPGWELREFKNDGSVEKVVFDSHNIFIGCQGCTMCVRQSFAQRIRPYWFEGWAHDEFVWKLSLSVDGLYIYHYKSLKRRVHDKNVSLHKMHDMAVRLKFLENLGKSHKATLKFSEDINAEEYKIKLLEKNIKATDLRIKLLKDKKYFNTVPLAIRYSDCYHKARAILMELYMAIKQ